MQTQIKVKAEREKSSKVTGTPPRGRVDREVGWKASAASRQLRLGPVDDVHSVANAQLEMNHQSERGSDRENPAQSLMSSTLFVGLSTLVSSAALYSSASPLSSPVSHPSTVSHFCPPVFFFHLVNSVSRSRGDWTIYFCKGYISVKTLRLSLCISNPHTCTVTFDWNALLVNRNSVTFERNTVHVQ